MYRIARVFSLSSAARLSAAGRPCYWLQKRRSSDAASERDTPSVYHSYLEAARAFSMDEVAQPTMPFAQGYAHYNTKYNAVLAGGVLAILVSVSALYFTNFFKVSRHRPLTNTPEGLEFLNHPHEGYHPPAGAAAAQGSMK